MSENWGALERSLPGGEMVSGGHLRFQKAPQTTEETMYFRVRVGWDSDSGAPLPPAIYGSGSLVNDFE